MVTITPTPTLLSETTSTVIVACTTAVPDTNGYVPPDACNANYGFYPRWEDNAAFAIAFGLTTCAHLAQAITLKKVRKKGTLTAVRLLTLPSHSAGSSSWVHYGNVFASFYAR